MSWTERLVETLPYANFIGMRAETEADDLVCVLPFADKIVGNARLPAVHGGVIGSFLELTALLTLIHRGERGPIPRTIGFSTDYLRSAGPHETRGHAEIVKLGRRIANVRVMAYQQDPSKPVAAGIGKFLL